MKAFRFSPWFEGKQKRKPSRNHFSQEILTHRIPGYEDEGSQVSQRRVRTTQGEKTGQFMQCYMKCLFIGHHRRRFGLIHHYELNFHVFPEKSTASIICTFGQFCNTKMIQWNPATSVIRSPRYYGHFFSAWQNGHTFPIKNTPVMRSPVIRPTATF